MGRAGASDSGRSTSRNRAAAGGKVSASIGASSAQKNSAPCGPCAGGVESTVIALTSFQPRLLRPGPVTVAQLEAVLGPIDATPAKLTGDAPMLVGELCRDPHVRGLSFTGSTTVGRVLAAQCAPTLKRVSLELGGHAPFIVFPDVDVTAAAEAAVAAKFQTSGQDCLAANRIFVHRDIYPAFVTAFTTATGRLTVGAGTQPGVDLGPVINQRTFDKSADHVADALAKGARLTTGGGRHDLGGLFFAPLDEMATKVLIQGADVQKTMTEVAAKFKSEVVPDYSTE